MEEDRSNLMKHVMTYGAIVGLALVIYSVLLYITGLTFNSYLGIFQWVILFLGLYYGTKSYRDKFLNGFITYGKGLGMGILISVFAGIISVFFSFLLMRYIDPGLVDKYLLIVEEQLESSRFIADGQIDLALEKSKEAMVAVWSIPVGVLSFAFFGFLISLATSAIVKKDPNPFA